MPKHNLTFKHFLGTRAPHERKREKSVNELLSSSRHSSNTPVLPPDREAPPHIWNQEEIHPAELLRRERVAHAAAARGVAGPAPPRSWRNKPRAVEVEKEVDERFVVGQLAVSARFLGTRYGADHHIGPPSLVSTCVSVILDTIARRVGGEHAAAYADAMLLASCQLDLGLRSKLLTQSASLAPSHPARLSDSAIKLLLEHSVHETHIDWDDDPPPTLSALALTTHPNPLRLLLEIPRLRALSLFTLDLSFATLPSMDRVVTALPPSLRALSLAGTTSAEYTSWVSGLGLLARKMTVLQKLDVSHCPIPIESVVHTLFGEQAPLPSLRRLGVRGNVKAGSQGEERMSRAVVKETVNRGRSGSKWVEIEFE